jgi:heme-degrading monooxygenase HmoA
MLCAGVVHGDLSEFNILLAHMPAPTAKSVDGPVIIDLPQAVDAAGNNHAQRMLLRDVANLRDFFGQFAPELLATAIRPRDLEPVPSGLLSNETPLTGRYAPDHVDVDMQAVLREIDDARDEDAARRLRMACANQRLQTKTQQSIPTTQVLVVDLKVEDLRAGGIAFITPSSITGQEEDKQALALAFTEIIVKERPDLGIISLPQTLSAVNRQGLTREYRQMFEDYRLTGIFDREILQKVANVTKTRYLAQLKLGAFRQESKNRFGMLGIRVLETKTSTIRLFLQIWDSQDGSVAWEGAQESTVSHESMAEEYVSMKSIVQESARDLVAHLP